MSVRRGILAPVVVVVIAVASGGWLLQRGVDRAENVYVKVRLLQEVVERVESSFVDEVDPDSLYTAAIDGLIRGLGDPHSSFLKASEYENLRIRTEGDYGGVGLEVIDRDGWVTVVAPIPGTPGARSGIRAGDRFYEIDGRPAEGMDVDAAVDLLRGRPGSKVDVKMVRPGVDRPIPFTLDRAVIELRSVPFAVMLEDGVGYVPLRVVREKSSTEVRAAVDSLRGEGMAKLVLDLRGNPGGLLEQGIGVSDLFLPSGEGIVETRGRDADQSETYRASTADAYPGLPLVVLMDGGSASAAEIIAGALQDHDRAVVVGAPSFGKGSVQTLYQLSGGNVLRLTTAKWYTPVGRSIQKDHEGPGVALGGSLDLSGRIVGSGDGEGRPEFHSDGGRTLYGGGGITPDVLVVPDTLTTAETRAVRALFAQGGAFNVSLFNFAVRYVRSHADLEPGFRLTTGDLDDFYRVLHEGDVAVDREDFRGARRFIRYQLEREIALQAWGDRGEFEQIMRFDNALHEAVSLLRRADSPSGLLGKVAGSGSGEDSGG